MIDRKLNLTDKEIVQITQDVVKDFSKIDPITAEIFQFIIDIGNIQNGRKFTALEDKKAELLREIFERGIN